MKLLESLKLTDKMEERNFRIEKVGIVIFIAILVGSVWSAAKLLEYTPYVCLAIALVFGLSLCCWSKVMKEIIKNRDEIALRPIMEIVDNVLSRLFLDQYQEIISEYTLREISRIRYCFDRTEFIRCLREYLVISARNENFKCMKKECSDEELKVGIAAILMTALFEFTLFEFPTNKEKEDMFNLYVYEKILERFFKGESKTFMKDCKDIVAEAYFQLEEEQEQLDYMYSNFCDEYAKEAAKKK